MNLKVLSPKDIGQAVRATRKQRGLTQQAAGHSVGMEQHTVSKIENGAPGTELNSLFRLLAALDLELVIQGREKPATDRDGTLW